MSIFKLVVIKLFLSYYAPICGRSWLLEMSYSSQLQFIDVPAEES